MEAGSTLLPVSSLLPHGLMHDPRAGLWESVSLPFDDIHAQEGLRVDHLHQEASVGGLLCLKSDMTGDLIVCNPLTGRYKRMRRSYETRVYDIEKSWTFVSAHIAWRVQDTSLRIWDPLQSLPMYIIISHTVIDPSGTGNFQLTFRRIHKHGGCTADMYDSRRSGGEWSTIANIPEFFCFVANGPIMHSSSGRIIFVFVDFSVLNDLRVLIYDTRLKQCSWLRTAQHQLRALALQSSRKMLIATMNCDFQLTFNEVRDHTGQALRLAAVPFLPSLERICKHVMLRIPDNVNKILDKVELLRVLCLGQGDVMFCIGVLRRSHSRPFNVISVLTHYRVDSSNNISDWYEWWPWTGDMLSATNFLIVQPSSASPESSSLQTNCS
ncbi:unnamed protein product [Calypogeia fissa]